MFFLLLGCIIHLGDDSGVACDASAAGSVNVDVSMSDGGDPRDASASYSEDGGRTFTPCDAYGGAGEFVCGWEVSGEILVRAEADGYAPSEDGVFVEEGVCHVIPERLSLVLEPAPDCTAEERVSVLATVVGSGGEDLSGVAVQWGYANADMAPVPCDDQGDGTWACGWEVAGELEVFAEADGHQGEMQVVEVTADECHVQTEEIGFALDWLPD